MSTETLLRTPLFEAHLDQSARMVPFAGWEMPVQYQSVIAEAKAVRASAGMFDVSHMARLWFRGPQTLPFLEHVTANDVANLGPQQGQYSLLLNDRGGCVDDIIVYRIEDDVFRMVVNAANHAKDVAWLKQHLIEGVEFTDETLGTAMIAVQGPQAARIVAGLAEPGSGLEEGALFTAKSAVIAGVPCFAPRSGYTGEDGFELICSAEHAVALWQALLEAGVKPCGLAARDALRVEAGLPLYGHELNDDLSPLSAGLGWVISKTKTYLGSEFMARDRELGTPTKLQGIKLDSKRLMEPGMVVSIEGRAVGAISSGVYSPTLEAGIGFAFLESSVKIGTAATVEIRGKYEPATVVHKRFLRSVRTS